MDDDLKQTAESVALMASEDLPYQAPLGPQFGDSQFMRSEALEGVLGSVIAKYHIRRPWIVEAFDEGDIGIAWKRKGGKDLGRCSVTNPVARHYEAPMFFIWIAADHLRGMAATRGQLEALIHHETLHVGFDMESGKAIALPHDAEVFVEEIRAHGIWRPDLAPLVATCKAIGAAA